MKFQKSYNEPRKRKNYLTKEGRNMQREGKDKEGGVECMVVLQRTKLP